VYNSSSSSESESSSDSDEEEDVKKEGGAAEVVDLRRETMRRTGDRPSSATMVAVSHGVATAGRRAAGRVEFVGGAQHQSGGVRRPRLAGELVEALPPLAAVPWSEGLDRRDPKAVGRFVVKLPSPSPHSTASSRTNVATRPVDTSTFFSKSLFSTTLC
jgi:hypothetical protein